MHTTVQDLGRPGLGSMGVARCGAADALSLRIGNRLLGNRDDDAALECTLVGPSLLFDADATVCIVGADCPDAAVVGPEGERLIAGCAPTRVRAGETVRLGALRDGARAYLCVSGGVRSPLVMGSRSTHASLGGRPLGRDAPIEFIRRDTPDTQLPALDGVAAWLREARSRRTLRVAPGLHADSFPRSALRTLTEHLFRVADRSNRVGIRLDGPPLPTPDESGRLPSEGMTHGVVQVPSDGAPIILGPDHPTTGGYAAIACVIAADLHLPGTIRPRDAIRFEAVTREEARRLRASQESSLDSLLPRAPVIDLNADVGEASTAQQREAEAEIITMVSAVNIACGGHAGDDAAMRAAIDAARSAGCAIGAHPSYPDREGFGRRRIAMGADDLLESLRAQIAKLGRTALALGVRLSHVKPHGALYHEASEDEAVARAVFEASHGWDPSMRLIGLAGSRALVWWRMWGAAVAPEAFIDRGYLRDGGLAPREHPAALVRDPEEAAARAVRLVRDGSVRTVVDSDLAIDARTVCIHADTPGATRIARGVRSALDAARVRVVPLESPS